VDAPLPGKFFPALLRPNRKIQQNQAFFTGTAAALFALSDQKGSG
jgi:hypothetical protein